MADDRSRIRRPSCLELTAGTSATNYINRPFQVLSQNVLIRADVVFSALETFCSMGYISLLYLLTYLFDSFAHLHPCFNNVMKVMLRGHCMRISGRKPRDRNLLTNFKAHEPTELIYTICRFSKLNSQASSHPWTPSTLNAHTIPIPSTC